MLENKLVCAAALAVSLAAPNSHDLCAAQATSQTIQSTTTSTTSAIQPYSVKVTGNGRSMILIPGLMCDGTVWNDTVAHYQDRYQCHVFSLAGFAGLPPVKGPFVATMRDAIVKYIRDNQLDAPIIIGHSLGGHLALAIAVAAPKEVGPIIVVDGAPALGVLMSPGTSTATLATRAGIMRGVMSMMSKDALAAQSHQIMATFVTDPKKVDALAKTAGKSDVKTVANAMYELSTADIRNEIANIETPVLLIGAAEFAKDEVTRERVKKAYKDQVAKVPNHRVEMTYDARHFIMLDQPEYFYGLVDEFLKDAE